MALDLQQGSPPGDHPEARAAYASMAADLAELQAAAAECRPADHRQLVRDAAAYGFALSCPPDGAALLHRSGAVIPLVEYSDGRPDVAQILERAWLALGGPLFDLAEPAAAPQSQQAPEPPASAAEQAPGPAAEQEQVDPIGPGSSVHPVADPELLIPLTEEAKAAAVAQLRALSDSQRRTFTRGFREHFQIPAEQRSVIPSIQQRQHLEYVMAYLDELRFQSASGATSDE